jgi:hypothetical protein
MGRQHVDIIAFTTTLRISCHDIYYDAMVSGGEWWCGDCNINIKMEIYDGSSCCCQFSCETKKTTEMIFVVDPNIYSVDYENVTLHTFKKTSVKELLNKLATQQQGVVVDWQKPL